MKLKTAAKLLIPAGPAFFALFQMLRLVQTGLTSLFGLLKEKPGSEQSKMLSKLDGWDFLRQLGVKNKTDLRRLKTDLLLRILLFTVMICWGVFCLFFSLAQLEWPTALRMSTALACFAFSVFCFALMVVNLWQRSILVNRQYMSFCSWLLG